MFGVRYVEDVILSGHTIVSDYTQFKIDQSLPPLVIFFALITLIPLSQFLVFIITLIAPNCFSINLNIDENLPNYFEALEKNDKESMVLEEEYLRENYVICVFNYL